VSLFSRSRIIFLGLAIAVYGILNYYAEHLLPFATINSPVSPVWFYSFLFVVILLIINFYLLPYSSWVYLIVLFIPFEKSTVFFMFMKLSPIDYFCAVAAIAVLFREKLGLFKKIVKAFGPISFYAWSTFLIFGFISAILLDGQIRGVLRWGEFLFCYFLGYLAVAEDRKYPRELSGILALQAVFLSVYAMIQFFLASGNYRNACAFFGQHNVFSAFMSLCLPASWTYFRPLEKNGTWVQRGGFLIVASGLGVAYSRGALIGLLTGATLLLALREKRKIFESQSLVYLGILFSVFSLIISFQFHETRKIGLLNPSGRLLYVKAAKNILQVHPWRGLGPGNYESKLPGYLTEQLLRIYQYELQPEVQTRFWVHLHSIYLQILVEYGFLGFFFWSLGIGGLLWKAYKNKALSPDRFWPYFMVSIIGFLVHNIVDVLTVSSLDLLFVFLLAYTTAPYHARLVHSEVPTD